MCNNEEFEWKIADGYRICDTLGARATTFFIFGCFWISFCLTREDILALIYSHLILKETLQLWLFLDHFNLIIQIIQSKQHKTHKPTKLYFHIKLCINITKHNWNYDSKKTNIDVVTRGRQKRIFPDQYLYRAHKHTQKSVEKANKEFLLLWSKIEDTEGIKL